jgi:hypothetical protein
MTPIEAMPSRASALIVSIAVLSAVAAFLAVRAWFVPASAAAVAPATLTVQTQPESADVLLDDEPRGKTPLTIRVDPGSHRMAIRTAGVERTVQLTAAPGAQLSQYFDLTAGRQGPGRLSIVTDPPGARVSIDGLPRGVSPLLVEDLAPADHLVSVASDTGSAQRSVTVASGVAKELMFSLPRSTAPVAGWIVVASPFPVEVIEHGETIATSGPKKVMLAVGRHTFVLRNGTLGYVERRTIDVAAGAVVSLHVTAPTTRLNVNAKPWADVLIDGAAAGQTPLANIEIAIGSHEITFRHPQFGERTERVAITASGINRVTVDLTK